MTHPPEEDPRAVPLLPGGNLDPEVRAQILKWIQTYKGYPTSLGHHMEHLLAAYDEKVKQLEETDA